MYCLFQFVFIVVTLTEYLVMQYSALVIAER